MPKATTAADTKKRKNRALRHEPFEPVSARQKRVATQTKKARKTPKPTPTSARQRRQAAAKVARTGGY